MSNIANDTSHIAWLAAGLASKRNRILSLIYRLTGLGAPSSLKPALFAKFSHWLDEVAVAKQEEIRIMTRIEDIEREHRFMRATNKLRRASPFRLDASDDCLFEEKAGRSTFRTSIELIVLWYLFLRQKINHKKQGLTAD